MWNDPTVSDHSQVPLMTQETDCHAYLTSSIPNFQRTQFPYMYIWFDNESLSTWITTVGIRKARHKLCIHRLRWRSWESNINSNVQYRSRNPSDLKRMQWVKKKSFNIWKILFVGLSSFMCSTGQKLLISQLAVPSISSEGIYRRLKRHIRFFVNRFYLLPWEINIVRFICDTFSSGFNSSYPTVWFRFLFLSIEMRCSSILKPL